MSMLALTVIHFGAFAAPTAEAAALPSNAFCKSSMSGDWKSTLGVRASFGMNNLVQKSDSTGTYLQTAYPKGSVSPAYARSTGAPIGGGQWTATCGKAPRDYMHLSYDYRFPVGFDFKKGGKLPGLYGGDGNTGGKIPTGKDGWTTRFMWREDGKGQVYAYLPTSSNYGTELGTGAWYFKADGKWHNIEQAVKMNTVGKSDGWVKVWVDGKQVFYKGGLKFRTTTSLKVDGMMFSTFFGGASSSWATPRWQKVDYDNFALGTSYMGT